MYVFAQIPIDCRDLRSLELPL